MNGAFSWQIPPRYNIGVDVSHGAAGREPAIISTDGERVTGVTTFAALHDQSNRLANALRAKGVRPGDRVAIVLPQRAETAVAHIAVYKLGAIAVPLSILFGPEALELRLADSGAGFLIGERRALETAVAAGFDL